MIIWMEIRKWETSQIKNNKTASNCEIIGNLLKSQTNGVVEIK